MSLSARVSVARRFQRSIRIDTDLNKPDALEGFVCPKSSAEVLVAMARHVEETGQGAFTWTGPYGSGKSSLVIALSALLSNNAKLRERAAAEVGRTFAKQVWRALPPGNHGWRVLPVVGRRDDPATVLGAALEVAKFPGTQIPKRKWTNIKLIEALVALSKVDRRKSGGLIVFIDEMGKFLDGAAHEGADIHLFQELAEAASRSDHRLIVVGILHQAFEEYAQRLSRDARDEWSKVQGRFVDLVVNTAGDEQLDLLARAITSDHQPARPSSLAKVIADAIRVGRSHAAPDLAATLEGCWPLHPVTAALLGPISRRRFGQNQRSLFGFLNSAEPLGFQEFLRDAGSSDLYTPDRLWDYLRANLEPSILASPDAHRWLIATEAIDRCEAHDGSHDQVRLLKCIALIDLFRERSGLGATPEVLEVCLTSKQTAKSIAKALAQLGERALIIYRKHLGAYGVYAGSDFDLEQALLETCGAFREINFKQLRAVASLQPILAKRHYHETGALRWFEVDLIPIAEIGSANLVELPTNGCMGRFLVAIPTANETIAKAKQVCQQAINKTTGNLVLGLSRDSWQVTDVAREYLAIMKIAEDRQELQGDPVARREVAARVADTRVKLEQGIRRMFDTADWFQAKKDPTKYSSADLNALASDIADRCYSEAPKIENELLNRLSPSSNAVAAEKYLLKHMVGSEGQRRLGIEGFPAEGALFDTIIGKANIYRKSKSAWRFVDPDKNDPSCLNPSWQAAVVFLEAHQDRPVAASELYELWKRPPYGVKDGLLAILFVAFLLSHRQRLAFYRDGVFQARFTDLEIDYLTIDPKSIQLRWMDLTDLSRRILSEMADVVRQIDLQNRLDHLEPIDVARGLVAIYDGLQPWTKRTARLSANALRVRSLFKKAADPNQFLFNDLPAMLGDSAALGRKGAVEGMITLVREGLIELTQAYGEMLGRLREMMLNELQVPNASKQALSDLGNRAENVRDLEGDFRLNAFINRLCHFTSGVEDMEGIASLATNKPSRDWVDSDLDHAGIEIAAMAQQFNRVESFARVKGRADKREAMAVVIGMYGRPTPVSGEFDITERDKGDIQELIRRVDSTLKQSDERRRNIILAALAELSARYLDQATPAREKKAAKV